MLLEDGSSDGCVIKYSRCYRVSVMSFATVMTLGSMAMAIGTFNSFISSYEPVHKSTQYNNSMPPGELPLGTLLLVLEPIPLVFSSKIRGFGRTRCE
ncbi:hypothetical protein BS47DRAFT_1044774 [Hydnum rufescens UP504]|uniref:Uncharacterized protein n=1 Tax=Hydnum rufescens UP504 TaxID=1448309 RepID=A0A9P6AAH5_9AGAM|nr:hypothetical protein BS47DRAFT_1044774 [Hydnum rufescens UP504]